MTRPHNPIPYVYLYRQGNFDAIPGSPWVYWITPGLRRVFEELPRLEEVAKPVVGLQTSDNFRFLRFWWEVGIDRIGFGCKSREEAASSEKKWFPHMKGGSFKRWWGNQEHVVNWWRDGKELRAFEPAVIRNPAFYFRRGVTWSHTTSKSLSVRYMPEGFTFNVEAPSCFLQSYLDLLGLLGVLNSGFADYALNLVNPTIHMTVGAASKAPVPQKSSNVLRELVEKAIELAKKDAEEDETTWDFVAPPDWPDGNDERGTMDDERGMRNEERGTMSDEGGRMKDENGRMGPEERAALLAEIERQIDEEVYRLYGISEEDRQAIEEELGMRNDEGGTRNDERGMMKAE